MKAPVLIDPDDLFILRVAAHQFVADHPDSPNVPSINAAIEAAVEAMDQKAAASNERR